MKSTSYRIRPWAGALFVCTLFFAALGGASASPSKVEDLMRAGDSLYRTFDQDPARLEEAIRCYREALALDHGNYTILWTLAEMFQSKGQMLAPERREEKIVAWDEGAEYGRRATKSNPDGKKGHYFYMANYGAAAQLQGLLSSIWKFRKIKRELDRTLDLDPNWPPVLVAKAQYLTEMPGIFGGSDEEAAALYRRAIQLDPHCSIAYYFLGELLARNKRYGEAVQCLNALIDCPDPGNRGNWTMVDVPKAKRLLQRIRVDMGTAGGPEGKGGPGGG